MMGVLSGEKQKNDAPRRIQWGLLIAGIAIGVVLTLVVTNGSRSTSNTVYVTGDEESIYATATYIVEQATGTAQAAQSSVDGQLTPAPIVIDPLFATATAVVQQATQQAASP